MMNGPESREETPKEGSGIVIDAYRTAQISHCSAQKSSRFAPGSLHRGCLCPGMSRAPVQRMGGPDSAVLIFYYIKQSFIGKI
jgi:hypothetical protein